MIVKAILAALGLMPTPTGNLRQVQEAARAHGQATRAAGTRALNIIDKQQSQDEPATMALRENVENCLRETLAAVAQRASKEPRS